MNNAQLVGEVQSHAAELEKWITEIKERTAKLEKVNEQLKKEIKERKRAEEAVRESEERYRDLYDNAPVMYHTIDTKGIVLDCNQTEADMLGYSKEEIIGKPIYTFQTKKYQDLAPHALHEGMEKGHVVGERRFVKKDGRNIDTAFEGMAIHNDSGKAVGFRSTVIDITHLKRAEEALRESESKYRSLFENMLNGFAYCKILLDENNQPIDFVYLEVNDSFEKLTGLRKEDVVGRKAAVVIPGIKETHPELFNIYGKVALNGEETKFDIYFEPLEIWLSISVYSPQKGYFVAVFENITDRKRAEEALRESEEKYRSLVESTEDCIYLVDENLRYLFANKKIQSRFDLPMDKVIGRKYGRFPFQR